MDLADAQWAILEPMFRPKRRSDVRVTLSIAKSEADPQIFFVGSAKEKLA